MSDIKIRIGAEKDCLQTISVEWPVSKVREKIEAAFESVRSQAKMPGFRPGKTPLEIVRENFKEAAYSKAQDWLLQEGVTEALKTKKIQALQPPVVQSLQFAPDKPFSFEFRVETAPNFKLTGHKGVKITKKIKSVTEADVEKALHDLAQMNARLVESSDETLKATHHAVVDYEGFLDGKPIEGAKAENFLLDMSAPQAILGLTEGLAGAKPREEREVTVKFPEDSPSPPLAGKQAVFKVKLQAIKEKRIPSLDNDFAKDLGLGSFDQLKTKLRENLQRDLEQTARKELETQIVERLIEENSFSLPQSLVQKQVDYLIARQRERLLRQGLSKEDQDKVLEGTKAETQRLAEREVRLAFILNAVADAEKIEVSEIEVNAKIAGILERSQPNEREGMEKILRTGYWERLQSDVRESKLFDWLIKNAKIKEISGGAS